ncbi:MAG TPA: PD-(D/E)XK nuclease family protein, partial [Anaeromyxobacter sp.]
MPALVIVATPLAAARAARRLCDAQGGLLFGPRIATLDRVVPGILAASGDRRAVLPPLAERLLAAEAGDAAGGALAGAAPDGGLAAALASAIAELRRGEVSAADAREAATALEGGAAARLRALADALATYEGALRRLPVLDRAGAARAAADAVRRGAASAETEALELLVVDGLHAASPAEWDLLAALAARAAKTRFHVPFMPERPDACGPAEPLLRRVEALHEIAARREIEVSLPRLGGEGRAPRAAALLAAFAGGRTSAVEGDGGLVLAEPGAGEAGEAEAAARVAGRLVESGIAPGDVALVAPAPRRAAPALARAFAAAGIPFAAGRGPALAEAPPVRVVLDALAAAGGLDRSAAERLAASSYLAPPGLAGLGALLDRAGSMDGRAAPQAALRARAARLSAPAAAREREALSRAAGALDLLEASLRPLAAAASGREHAARIAGFVEVSGLRRRALRAPRDVAARDLAAISALLDAADGLARALALAGRGGERLPSAAYRSLLALAVAEASLPPPAEPATGAVELSGMEDAPGLSARGVVLLGCARGAWPVPPAPEPLLREPERQALNRHLRRSAVATSGSRRAESSFRAFSAAAAGREAIAFVWPARGPAGDGAQLAAVVSDALSALG